MPVTVIEPCVSLLGCKNTRMSVPVVPVLLPGQRKKPNCVEFPSGVLVPLSLHVPAPEPLHMPCSGSIVVAKAPDAPRASAPTAAAPARTEENLAFNIRRPPCGYRNLWLRPWSNFRAKPWDAHPYA